jgi:hypothetical protein
MFFLIKKKKKKEKLNIILPQVHGNQNKQIESGPTAPNNKNSSRHITTGSYTNHVRQQQQHRMKTSKSNSMVSANATNNSTTIYNTKPHQNRRTISTKKSKTRSNAMTTIKKQNMIIH